MNKASGLYFNLSDKMKPVLVTLISLTILYLYFNQMNQSTKSVNFFQSHVTTSPDLVSGLIYVNGTKREFNSDFTLFKE